MATDDPGSVGRVPASATGDVGPGERPHPGPDVTTWDVQVLVFAYPTSVNARAELALSGTTVDGHRHAGCLPGDPNVPDIGRRVAVGRALHDPADVVEFAAGNDMVGSRNRAHLECRPPADPA